MPFPMKTNSKNPDYIYVTYINTTAAKLWAALIDPELIKQYWMGRQNTSTWKKGAALESRSPEGELEWHGQVVEAKKPRRLVYTFQGEESKEPYTLVTFEIEAVNGSSPFRGRGVKLTVTHGGFGKGSKLREGVSRGWPAILSGLKSLLETGQGLGLKHDE